jgi:hypothetical protein
MQPKYQTYSCTYTQLYNTALTSYHIKQYTSYYITLLLNQ